MSFTSTFFGGFIFNKTFSIVLAINFDCLADVSPSRHDSKIITALKNVKSEVTIIFKTLFDFFSMYFIIA